MTTKMFSDQFMEILSAKGEALSYSQIAECVGLDKSTIGRWAEPGSTIQPKRANIISLRNCGFSGDEVNALLLAAGYTTLKPQEAILVEHKSDLTRYLEEVKSKQTGLDFSPFMGGQERDFTHVELDKCYVPLRHYHHYCKNTHHQPICRRTFFEFLADYFHDYYDLDLETGFYRQILKSGHCLLCLDGFDEVPGEDDRRQVVSVVRELANEPDIGLNVIILSSRVAAYGGTTQLGGHFQTLWVQPLNADERKRQIQHWVREINPQTERNLNAEDILDRMPAGSPLDQLATTPMIVTTLCVVYFYDHQLPEQRARLYRRCVDIMLYERLRPDDPGRTLAEWAGKPDLKRELLARLAFELHRDEKEGVNKEKAALWLKDGFKSKAEEERLPAARDFLDNITIRGTLLQERDRLFGFGQRHLTFQEFLAGYYLALVMRPRQRQKLWPDLVLDDRWREPIRLAAGATMPDNAVACEALLEELLELADGVASSPALRLAGYKLAAEGLFDLGESGRLHIEKELQDDIIGGLAACLTDPDVANPEADLLHHRVQAAQTLGHLGDPREGVTSLPPRLTPPIAGDFLFGENQDPRPIERPFRAGVYPVTNAQYRLFMEAGGYTPSGRTWWSKAGKAWLKDSGVTEPRYWSDPRFNNPNQPVVGISWYEAEAFCNWLSATYGKPYRLPTEEEWERLARGQTGQEYPWGNEWQAGLANTDESNIGQTSAVGIFPGGASPTGAYDCAGNVWEWCASWYDQDEEFRVVRGGSWHYYTDYARCAFRSRNDPDGSFDLIGFRLVSPIGSES